MSDRPRRSWPRRLLRFALVAGVVFVVALLSFVVWARATCFAEPPELGQEPAIRSETVHRDGDGRARIGASWFEERPGASLIYLEGDPYALGYSNARLTSSWIAEQERSLMATMRTFLPSDVAFYSLALVVLVNNRSLPSYVDLEYQLEILGLADGSENLYPHLGSVYHRILNYHAAHDIAHWVWDEPVVGCNAFAVAGEWTRDGHLLVGRNFDFEAGREFDEHKLIALYRPTDGKAFLSVVWPGMAGAVTGINEDRLYCSINGAHSADQGRIGTPVSLVVREVLQYAEDLDHAVEIIRGAQVFVADSYLLADGRSGRAVVVEKTPERTGVREMVDGLLLQSNHFESAALADDPGNLNYMRSGTSLARHARMMELVERARGELDAERAVAILRDRRGAGDRELGLGHRGTLCAMIATHSVVVDVSAGVLWVSRGPHQLGAFEAHSIEAFGAPLEVLPESPELASGAYAGLLEVRAILERLNEELLASDQLSEGSRGELARALELAPGSPDVLLFAAYAEEARGDRAAALARYREALNVGPAFQADRDEIEGAIARLEANE